MAEKAKDIRLLDSFSKLPEGRFAGNLISGPGFSLSYSGLSHAAVMERLTVTDDKTDKTNPDRPVRRVRLKDPLNGLSVTLEYRLYPEHNAIVYGAVVKNDGNENIEHLTALYSYDLTFSPLQVIGNPAIHTIGGGVWNDYYPPSAYKLQERSMLGPAHGITIDSGPDGRSSNKDLPFFFVEDGDSSSGIFGGVEWSGMWHVTFTRRDEPAQLHYGHLGPDKYIDIQGGIDGIDLQLRTGEVFHMPRVLLGFYEGPISAGRNRLRRFIRDWSPNLANGKSMPLIMGTPGGYILLPEDTVDGVCRKNAAAMADIGVEYYVVEAWFESKSDRPHALGATGACRGNWTPDSSRFPDMKGFSDYIRSLGMGFGLWTDMEVANAQSRVARDHPDWVLYLENNADGLLNFALPQVQEWVIATYDSLINAYGLEWIFYDNNISPNPFWEAHEPKHRQGRLHHDYIRGVWRVWDEILKRHPNVVLENCSSGGRRIDLGTLGRSHCSFTSDQFRFPDSIRYQFSGANTAIPGNRIKTFICQGLNEYPDYSYHSRFGGFLGITEGVEDWSAAEVKKARKHFKVYKSIRHLLGKDFYPLFPQPQTLREWDGWQFHDPENQEGFILAFRAKSLKETASLKLCGLDPEKEYIVENPYTYTQSREVCTGAELMEKGLLRSLKCEDSCLLTYRLKGRKDVSIKA